LSLAHDNSEKREPKNGAQFVEAACLRDIYGERATMKGLRKSYFIDARHGELYTGGPVSLHPALGLLLPQQSQLNTLSINNPNLSVSAIVGVRQISILSPLEVFVFPTNSRFGFCGLADLIYRVISMIIALIIRRI
jgi:hypothetical protein